jgi:hypothetical protein
MVDKSDIKEKLNTYFKVVGKVTIHESGIVDVKGNVYLKRGITDFPIQFGEVSGEFFCDHNLLTSLKGSPHTVAGNFRCDNNKLTSLAHAPRHVGGDFCCNNNQLTSLQHAPHILGGTFRCDFNKLTSLQHAPHDVKGLFNCSNNQLQDLTGSPGHVGGGLTCANNPLSSLNGIPEHVGGTLWLNWNPRLSLLRALSAQQVMFFHADIQGAQVASILNKYTQQGKPGAIKAAAELVKAGYKDNARW